jgi:hypothetical protein
MADVGNGLLRVQLDEGAGVREERRESDQRLIVAAGLVATLGALIVGIGEFAMQFSPGGGYESPDYRYFLDVSAGRLRFGHFLGVLAAPLYIVGYWHVSRVLEPAHPLLRRAVFLVGGYAFAIANVWLGQRIFLAQTVKARAVASPQEADLLGRMLEAFANDNEPLIQIVRVLILVVSILIAVPVVRGRTGYPRWMVAFTPIVLLGLVFASYMVMPAVGTYLLPAAMNVAHVAFFGLSTWVFARAKQA